MSCVHTQVRQKLSASFWIFWVCFVAVEKPLEMTNVTKMKTESSSSGSSDSSGSEDSDNGNIHTQCRQRIFFWEALAVVLQHISFPRISLLCISYTFCLPGLVPKLQKKILTNKDTKRLHNLSLSTGGGPVALQPQVVQSKPPFVPPPPVQSLDSSQLMGSGFDPLAQFMNPHLAQSNAEPNPTITTAGAAVVSGLFNANPPTGQTPTETLPFLNQHPIIPSPGMYTCIRVLRFRNGHDCDNIQAFSGCMWWLFSLLMNVIDCWLLTPLNRLKFESVKK